MEVTNQTPPNQTTSPNSFGAQLSEARKKQNITLEEVAGELYILKRHLQALEAEDFAALPQAAFARGFAVNYAKYLGLDPHQIVAGFDAAYPEELKPKSVQDIESPLRPMGTLHRDSRSKIRFNPILIVAIVALIALAVFLYRMVTNASDEQEVSQPEVETLSIDDQAQGAAVNTGVAIDTSGVGASGSAIGVATGNDAQGSATLSDAQLANVADATLDFWVQNNTDISVTDAAGTVLMTGTQSRGGYKVSGKPPFRVQIAQVSNVDLNLNQQPIALDDYATNNQASFTLSP